MRHYYLVDYENVGARGLNGLKYVGSDSHIRIFISGAANMANEEVRKDILASNACIDTFHCKVSGRNALDFEVAAYVGAVLENAETERVSIISNDGGYKALADYASRAGKNAIVYRASTILEAYVADKEGLTEPPYQSKNSISFGKIMKEVRKRQIFEKEICEQLHNYDDETAEKALELISDGTPREQYLGLLKLLGREKGTKLYRYVKTKSLK